MLKYWQSHLWQLNTQSRQFRQIRIDNFTISTSLNLPVNYKCATADMLAPQAGSHLVRVTLYPYGHVSRSTKLAKLLTGSPSHFGKCPGSHVRV